MFVVLFPSKHQKRNKTRLHKFSNITLKARIYKNNK